MGHNQAGNGQIVQSFPAIGFGIFNMAYWESFFFTDTAPPEIYTLSLHDALPIFPNKTIVLTGALTPARFSESDAAFNLGMAFATAQTGPPGVYITINGTVFPADQVVK